MSLFSNFFHVKQKPIFTGYRFGFGSASGPTGPTGPLDRDWETMMLP